MAYFKTYAELAAYFEGLPATVTSLKGVTVGADEEMLNQQNSRILYPHLRVDTPEFSLVDEDDTPRTRYKFTLFVLTHEPKKTNSEANAKLSAMATLCEKILKRLWVDSDEGKFDLVIGDKGGDAVRLWSGDNAYGWWFNVTIDLFTDECD
jgi:hypothetical protein